MRVFLQRYALIFGLILALALAVLFQGRHDSSGHIAAFFVVGIFFLSGFVLPSGELLRGLSLFKIHFFIQLFSFVLTPALVWICLQPFKAHWSPAVSAGVYALACLPTTVSSCVAFTHVARGNTAVALFNAVLGNALGVLLTPALLSLLLGATGFGPTFAQIVKVWQSLALKLVVPFLAGQGIRSFSVPFAVRLRTAAMVLTNSFLLGLVFLVFAEALTAPAIRHALRDLPALLVFLTSLHLVLLVLAGVLSRALGLVRGDLIAVVFTATQKTLGLGAPLIAAYFAENPAMRAIAMMPLLFYHPLQLFVAGLLTARFVAANTDSSV